MLNRALGQHGRHSADDLYGPREAGWPDIPKHLHHMYQETTPKTSSQIPRKENRGHVLAVKSDKQQRQTRP